MTAQWRCTWCGTNEIEASETGCPRDEPVCPMAYDVPGFCSHCMAPEHETRAKGCQFSSENCPTNYSFPNRPAFPNRTLTFDDSEFLRKESLWTRFWKFIWHVMQGWG